MAYLTLAGVNDYSAELVASLGLLAIETRPALGSAILAVAAALKPYAFALGSFRRSDTQASPGQP